MPEGTTQQQQQQAWDNGDSSSPLLDAERAVSRKVKSIWQGFMDFALRDSVIEVALGLIIATAFTKLVNSLVSDILLPPLSLLGSNRNLGEKFLVLRKGPKYYDRKPTPGYNTREQALLDGAVIWTYGAFIDNFVAFLGVGLALYAIALVYGHFAKTSLISKTVRCEFCRKEISAKARRCPMCTSWVDGREDKETSAIPHNAVPS